MITTAPHGVLKKAATAEGAITVGGRAVNEEVRPWQRTAWTSGVWEGSCVLLGRFCGWVLQQTRRELQQLGFDCFEQQAELVPLLQQFGFSTAVST